MHGGADCWLVAWFVPVSKGESSKRTGDTRGPQITIDMLMLKPIDKFRDVEESLQDAVLVA